MMNLDQEALRRLQEAELEILIEVDRICRKNHIHYSLTGGTLLGAVRHGGFIPWDDDADISMLRSEYRKFQQACRTDLDTERFYFQDIEHTPGYRWGYGKVRRKDSIFLREGQEEMPYEQGIFLDVFPRDGVPDGPFLRKLHTFFCFAVRKMMWSAVGRKSADTRIQRCVYQILYWLTRKHMVDFYKCLQRCSNRKKTEYVRTLTFPLPNHLKGYRREWYRSYRKVAFEGHSFQAQASYQEWLTWEFGDYQKLPPIEKRKTHPVTIIRFPAYRQDTVPEPVREDGSSVAGKQAGGIP